MNSELLTSISQKLQHATKTSILQRKRQKIEAQQQMAAIEQTLQQRRIREQYQIQLTKQKIQQLGQSLEDTVRTMAMQSTREGLKVATIRDDLEMQVQNIQLEHQEKIENIMMATEEKAEHLSEELEKKAKSHRDKMESYLNSLSKKLVSLQKEFKQETGNRKQGEQRLKNRFYDELSEFKGVIEKERERRVSSQRKIHTMIEEIQQKLDQQVDGLTSKRRKNNQSLLKLIQLACLKIQQKSQQH